MDLFSASHMLLTCATVGAAVGQRGADAAAERVEAAFRRGDPVEARAARLEAGTAVPASGSAALVEVLCDAWTACHHMALKVRLVRVFVISTSSTLH